LDKLIAHEQGGTWRDRVLLLADNPDAGGDFKADSARVAALAGSRDVSSLNVGVGDVSVLRAATVAHLNEGVGVFHYMGHAGLTALAGEGVFGADDIPALTNSNKPPIMVAAACAVGQFGIPGYDALGESLVTAPQGGVVAVWGAGGGQYHADGRRLDAALMEHILQSMADRLGDCVSAATDSLREEGVATHAVSVYNLLGDPATALLTPDAPVGARPQAATMTFEEWQRLTFAPVRMGEAGAQDDPNGDGVVNWMAYVLDTGAVGPADIGRFPLLQVEAHPGDLIELSFLKRQGAVVYCRVEMRKGLLTGTWADISDRMESQRVGNVVDTMEEVILDVRLPEGSGRTVFLRVLVDASAAD